MLRQKIETIYKSQLFTRYDDTGLVNYFSHKNFQGLNAKPYAFKSSHGHPLQGYFYDYDSYDPTRLIIFDHGLGGGHRSYMKEIECLCAAGYRVFTYDHSGCMASGGAHTGGFARSLGDLDDALKALKKDDDIPTNDISIMGHSWGGLATLNITALHPDIRRLVVLSGPISVNAMMKQTFPGFLRGYRKHILKLEAEANPDYMGYDAVSTLKNTTAKALLIYSDNDGIVKKKYHYDILRAALGDRENIQFYLTENKRHNPNYTVDAVQYLGTLAAAMKKQMPKTEEEKAAFRNSFDWHRMTAQDEDVWAKIIDFLS